VAPPAPEQMPAWHEDAERQKRPEGKGADWSRWREDNLGAARRSRKGDDAPEKNKEVIMMDPD